MRKHPIVSAGRKDGVENFETWLPYHLKRQALVIPVLTDNIAERRGGASNKMIGCHEYLSVDCSLAFEADAV